MEEYAAWIFVAAAIAIYLIIFFFSSIVKLILRFGLKAAAGALGIAAFNYAFAGAYISLNLITCGVCGILGIPGFLLLIGVRILYL